MKPKLSGDIIHIKEASLADVARLSELIRHSYRDIAARFKLAPANCPKHPSNYTDEWVENDFARGVSYYLLEHRGIPAGCVAIEKANPDLCYLERLAVLPHERKKGLGSQLVEHVFRKAQELGSKNISIGIIAKQTELKQWYQKFGFKEGETKEFSHLPFQVTFMTCEL
jgi:N-acetylglutamate synthase-like GNAT family acetyltransferase